MLNHWLLGRRSELTDISMTGLAFQFTKGDMSPVGEVDMIRDLVDPFPANGAVLHSIPQELLLDVRFCHGIYMAVLADLDTWESSLGMLQNPSVTICAFQPGLVDVQAMIEGKRLSNGFGGEAESNRYQYYNDQNRSQGDPPNLIQSISSNIDHQSLCVGNLYRCRPEMPTESLQLESLDPATPR